MSNNDRWLTPWQGLALAMGVSALFWAGLGALLLHGSVGLWP